MANVIFRISNCALHHIHFPQNIMNGNLQYLESLYF